MTLRTTFTGLIGLLGLMMLATTGWLTSATFRDPFVPFATTAGTGLSPTRSAGRPLDGSASKASPAPTPLPAQQSGPTLLIGRVLLLLAAAGGSSALLFAAVRWANRNIFYPLDHIRSRLDRLADDCANDRVDTVADHTLAGTTAFADLSAMQAALDRLCHESARRSRMQAELARLGDHAVTVNREMAQDLEAAARVQRSQLPAGPLRFPGGTFHALYRPSRVIAGDTYDCLPLPDGRSRVFQVDVAGHGAPAALVSVASHIALKQSLLAAPPSEPLAAIIARANRDWAGDLPYFTLLAVEIDPASATATFVQCGHPAILRLPAEGGVEPLGKGGLPIGVLPDADFSAITCPFRSGDRLVLATDGVTETADPEARMFGDDRFRALLAADPKAPVSDIFHRIEHALWDWRGSETLDDDITILVLEAA